MISSFCIKTNQSAIIHYLIESLESFSSPSIRFSQANFSLYQNVIIHCKKKNLAENIDILSFALFSTITKFYEARLLKMMLKENYFYFSSEEQKQILTIAKHNLTRDVFNFESKKMLMTKEIQSYLSLHKSLILDGFVFFRLPEYTAFLDYVLTSSINEYIIEKEYQEFIHLLKAYIATTKSNAECVHLVYNQHTSFLLDENLNYIEHHDDIFEVKYLSDISFSENDYTLNALLTLLPKKIHLHLLTEEDEFIQTLKKIFGNRICICTNCNICRIYGQKKM